MKRKYVKRLLPATVTAAMLATLFNGGVHASAETAQNQENGVAAYTTGYDTTAPVIESVSIDKQGETIGEDDTFKISIKAYDSDSGIQDISLHVNTQSENAYPGNLDYSYADGDLQFNEATNCYECTIKVSDAGILTGKAYISLLSVTDKAGNYSRAVVSSTYGDANAFESDALYWVDVQRNDSERPVITSVQLKENGQTVKPGNTIHLTISATDNSALSDFSTVYFYPSDKGDNHTMYLEWDASAGCYTGTWDIPDTIVPGEYYINQIDVTDVTGNRAEVEGTIREEYRVTIQNDSYVDNEKNAPKINSFSMDKAGETLTAGDQVKFTADVTDDTGVNQVKITLNNAQGIGNVTGYMENIEGTSQYEYIYTITEDDYPCEWYVMGIEARDVYGNYSYTSEESGIGENGKNLSLMYNYYFNVTNNGTFVQPNVRVTFQYLNADMKWESKIIEVPRRTSTSQVMEQFTPDVKFDKAEFTGWTAASPGAYEDVIIYNGAELRAAYSCNVVERYVTSYSPYVGLNVIYYEISFVKKGEKVELPTVFPGYKNVNWCYTEDTEELVNNGYIINTDNGYIINTDAETYWFEADAETDETYNPGDNNNNNDSDNNNNNNNGNSSGNNNDGKNDTAADDTTNKNEGTKLSSEKIQDAVAAIQKTQDGKTYTIEMEDATVVPKDVLEAAKGKDIDVVLQMNGYKWTINGKNIKADNLKDINLAVDTNANAIPGNVISDLAGNNPVKQISLAYSGDFGFQASLSYNIGKEYAEKYGNLYYYDSTGKMIFQNAGAIDADGNVSLTFSHASEYAVVITDTPATTDGTKESVKDAPKTGDSNAAVWYLLLGGMGSAVVGFVVMRRKKNTAV